MTIHKNHLEEVAAFIKEHRSNEAAFEKLYTKLKEENELEDSESDYKKNLTGIKEKAAEEYKVAREQTGSAWPEFEKFVTGFEKAVLQALHS